jgi:hypothetical protein
MGRVVIRLPSRKILFQMLIGIYRLAPPSSFLVWKSTDSFCNMDFASSKLSVVKPIEVLPEPFKVLSFEGCNPITNKQKSQFPGPDKYNLRD